jgi:hypothetical protein
MGIPPYFLIHLRFSSIATACFFIMKIISIKAASDIANESNMALTYPCIFKPYLFPSKKGGGRRAGFSFSSDVR